jgi:hypothetical protein
MVVIHAAQKLLNTSRIEGRRYVTAAGEGQMLQNWYARLVKSSFRGHLFTLYVHHPTLMAVLCYGKTIKTSFPVFLERLPMLLDRFDFPAAFIQKEMGLMDEVIVSKAGDKSMVGHMNNMIFDIEYQFGITEVVDASILFECEDYMMRHFHKSKVDKKYTMPISFWREHFNNPEMGGKERL